MKNDFHIKFLKKDEWDNLFKIADIKTIFHLYEWLDIVSKFSNSKFYPLAVYKRNTPVALCPIFLVKFKKIFKVSLSPVRGWLIPYLGYCYINIKNLKQNKKENILYNVQKMIDNFVFNEMNAFCSEIRTSPGFKDSRFLLWQGYCVKPLYTYRLKIHRGIEDVWKSFSKELRRNITKALKNNVEVEEGTFEDILFINEKISERMVEQNRSRKFLHKYNSYLKSLYKVLYPEFMKVFVAKVNRERITGQIVLMHDGRVYFWMGSPKIEVLRGTPNELLQWKIIEWAHENGFHEVEIIDSGDNPRLIHFKSKFNPDIEPWFLARKYKNKFFNRIGNFLYPI